MEGQATGQTSESEILVGALRHCGDTVTNGRFFIHHVPGGVYLRPRHAVLAGDCEYYHTLE